MPYQVQTSVKLNNTKPLGKAVKRHLDYWVPMLRLDDWTLSVQLTKYKKKDKFWARVKTQPRFTAATIELVDPRTDPSRLKFNDDEQDLHIEVSIVHELLHIRYEWETMGIDRDKNIGGWMHYEAGTEVTARALVAARRGRGRILFE